MDLCSPPGFSVYGILQARVQEQVLRKLLPILVFLGRKVTSWPARGGCRQSHSVPAARRCPRAGRGAIGPRGDLRIWAATVERTLGGQCVIRATPAHRETEREREINPVVPQDLGPGLPIPYLRLRVTGVTVLNPRLCPIQEPSRTPARTTRVSSPAHSARSLPPLPLTPDPDPWGRVSGFQQGCCGCTLILKSMLFFFHVI